MTPEDKLPQGNNPGIGDLDEILKLVLMNAIVGQFSEAQENPETILEDMVTVGEMLPGTSEAIGVGRGVGNLAAGNTKEAGIEFLLAIPLLGQLLKGTRMMNAFADLVPGFKAFRQGASQADGDLPFHPEIQSILDEGHELTQVDYDFFADLINSEMISDARKLNPDVDIDRVLDLVPTGPQANPRYRNYIEPVEQQGVRR